MKSRIAIWAWLAIFLLILAGCGGGASGSAATPESCRLNATADLHAHRSVANGNPSCSDPDTAPHPQPDCDCDHRLVAYSGRCAANGDDPGPGDSVRQRPDQRTLGTGHQLSQDRPANPGSARRDHGQEPGWRLVAVQLQRANRLGGGYDGDCQRCR